MNHTLFACDLVLNTPDGTPDREVLAAVDLLEDPDRPRAQFDRQLAVVMVLWLRKELGREAVAQLRSRHAAKAAA